jgi:gamma-glutamylcyclotransferase (GGCT)/AIG2-like uncharacterized protein YtfP
MRSRYDEASALFVYGSLLNASHRQSLIGRSIDTIPARLVGYERRKGRYFYVAKRAGSETAGLVLLALSAAEFQILDRYEDVPRLYTRERVEVIGAKGEALRCWVYLPTSRLGA